MQLSVALGFITVFRIKFQNQIKKSLSDFGEQENDIASEWIQVS